MCVWAPSWCLQPPTSPPRFHRWSLHCALIVAAWPSVRGMLQICCQSEQRQFPGLAERLPGSTSAQRAGSQVRGSGAHPRTFTFSICSTQLFQIVSIVEWMDVINAFSICFAFASLFTAASSTAEFFCFTDEFDYLHTRSCRTVWFY